MSNLQPEVESVARRSEGAQEEKARLRRLAKSARRRMSRTQRERAGESIAQSLFATEIWKERSSIALYLSVGDEVPTQRILLEAQRLSKAIALPRVLRAGGGLDVEFRWHSHNEDLEEGPMGIPQPSSEAQPADPAEIDLWLVPGLAFDRSGGRVGYGKGLYDRALQRASGNAVIVGLGFDSQRFERTPMEARDVPMDYLITESGWRETEKSANDRLYLQGKETR